MFLRALPDPLFTFRFYSDFIDAFKLPVRDSLRFGNPVSLSQLR